MDVFGGGVLYLPARGWPAESPTGPQRSTAITRLGARPGSHIAALRPTGAAEPTDGNPGRTAISAAPDRTAGTCLRAATRQRLLTASLVDTMVHD